MTQRVVHQPRVAWDVARTVVDVAGSSDELSTWLGARLDHLLGPSYGRDFASTRIRLARGEPPNVRQVEMGLWRARLEDVLRADPELAENLSILRLDLAHRLRT
jgi:hypothetical protein